LVLKLIEFFLYFKKKVLDSWRRFGVLTTHGLLRAETEDKKTVAQTSAAAFCATAVSDKRGDETPQS